MFDSCLRLAPNHLLPLAFCVSKRTLRSTREGFFYLLSLRLLPARPFFHEALFQQPRHGKRPYLHPLRSHNSARQTSEPLRPLLLRFPFFFPLPLRNLEITLLKIRSFSYFRSGFFLSRVFRILYSSFCVRQGEERG